MALVGYPIQDLLFETQFIQLAIDQLETERQKYGDINSQFNQQLRTNINQGVTDVVGQQNLLNQRNLSSGGMGGFSGIANQNLATTMQGALSQGEQAFQQSFQQNQKMATSLLNEYIKNQQKYGETMAQGHISNEAMRANINQQAFGGIGQGFMKAGLGSLFPTPSTGSGN